MNRVFSDVERKKHLIESVESWLGTPYRHAWGVKGRGADCVLFIGGVLVEIGVLKRLQYEPYTKDWYRNGQKEIVLDGLHRNTARNSTKPLELYEVESLEGAKVGDLIGFSTCKKTGLTNHCAIYLGNNEIAHCLQRVGVIKEKLRNTWIKRMTKIMGLKWAQV